ncbi:MAG: hydrogenase formation protein HypD [Methanosarcinales archaeon]|nr:MAG: hydrogenase formation protein HypD [Methanosarcinales archaeon]
MKIAEDEDPTPEGRAARLICSLMPDRPISPIHVCGTHEQAITKHGIRSLPPDKLEVLSGPGLRTPAEDIDHVIAIAKSGATILTYRDILRVPGSKMSLTDARAEGADVRIVCSANDAVRRAEQSADDIVFFRISFETTTPSNAAVLMNQPPPNFSIFASHRLIPPAMDTLIDDGLDLNIDGFIAPGHVATIIGTHPYERFAKMGYPIAVAGFEPIDILFAIIMILRQIRGGEAMVENAYTRAVNDSGNTKARELVDQVFEVVDAD